MNETHTTIRLKLFKKADGDFPRRNFSLCAQITKEIESMPFNVPYDVEYTLSNQKNVLRYAKRNGLKVETRKVDGVLRVRRLA